MAIKRRTDGVEVFPDSVALLRLAGAVLVEQHAKWEVGDHRYLSEASIAQLNAFDTPTARAVGAVFLIPGLNAA